MKERLIRLSSIILSVAIMLVVIIQDQENSKATSKKCEGLYLTADVCFNTNGTIIAYAKSPSSVMYTMPIVVEETNSTTDTEAIAEITYKSIDEIYIAEDMKLNGTTGISREDFCDLLKDFKYDYAGFYKENAGIIWDICQEYQINELFICGVFALESYWGSDDYHINLHNYGSITRRDGTLASYETDEEGIRANIALLAENYLNPNGKYYEGGTLVTIGPIYCPPNPNWSHDVYKCMEAFICN